MSSTNGINHPGLAVKNLDATRDFFVTLPGWTEAGRDDSYPRTAVTDGTVLLTLWQVASEGTATAFDRRQNIGLHHLALEVPAKTELTRLADVMREANDATIKFEPAPVGDGPREHMIVVEPGGIRVELIWPGQ